MLSKTIVVVSSNALSEQVVKNRLMPFLNLLLNKRCEVVLVCPSNINVIEEQLNGVRLVEVKISETRSTSFIQRALKEVNASAYLLAIARRQKADVYLITIPSMFLAFLAPVFLYNSKVVLDIRDITWEYLSDHAALHKYSKRLIRLTFKNVINFYKAVSVTNNTELSYVKNIWKRKRPVLLTPNGIMKDQFDKVKEVKIAKNSLLTVTYIGSIGLPQHLETLVLAAKELQDVKFRIVGSGMEQDKINKLILENKLENIEIIGEVPWYKVIDYYSETDILYAQLTPEFSGAMPSKLYEYLATGKYIIYGGSAQATKTLSNFHNNSVIRPCNTKELVEAILYIKNDSRKTEINYENREKIKQRYIREESAKKLIECIYDIAIQP